MIADCISAAIKIVDVIDTYLKARTKHLIECQTIQVDIETSVKSLTSVVHKTQTRLEVFQATEPVIEEQDICKAQITILSAKFSQAPTFISEAFEKLRGYYKKKHAINLQVYPKEQYYHDMKLVKDDIDAFTSDIEAEFTHLQTILLEYHKLADKFQVKFKPIRAIWIVNGWKEHDGSINGFLNYSKGKPECYSLKDEVWKQAQTYLTQQILAQANSHASVNVCKNGSYVLDYSLIVALTNKNCNQWKNLCDCILFFARSAQPASTTTESSTSGEKDIVQNNVIQKEIVYIQVNQPVEKTPSVKDAFVQYCLEQHFNESANVQLRTDSCSFEDARAFMLVDEWGQMRIYTFRTTEDAIANATGTCAKIILNDKAHEVWSGGIGFSSTYNYLRSNGRVWLSRNIPT